MGIIRDNGVAVDWVRNAVVDSSIQHGGNSGSGAIHRMLGTNHPHCNVYRVLHMLPAQGIHDEDKENGINEVFSVTETEKWCFTSVRRLS